MVNVDIYLRNVIYDKRNENDYITAGYYNDDDKEILNYYTYEYHRIEEYERGLAEATTEQNKERYKQWLEEEKNNSLYRKFENEDVTNYSKVLTIANCVTQLQQENGKYVVHRSGSCGNIYEATECEDAKKMKEENAKNNEAIKSAIVSKINSTQITPDVKENEEVQTDLEKKEDNSNHIVFYVMIILLVVFIIILIILIILRRKSNGKEGK